MTEGAEFSVLPCLRALSSMVWFSAFASALFRGSRTTCTRKQGRKKGSQEGINAKRRREGRNNKNEEL